MKGKVFLRKGEKELVELGEESYEKEDILQRLISKYPGLLAGEQIDPDRPRRWILVGVEMPVPVEPGGGGQFSLDNFYLDQDAIPTLVEVKRSSDTRTRREVVAQMLEYAANATAFWPVELLQAKFDETCRQNGLDPYEELGKLLGESADPDEFWQRVKTNLQAGKIRLLFVADHIPETLKRIVEFLNEQMDPAEVLAVEVRQYVSGEHQVLVSRVIGQTSEAIIKKRPYTPGRPWNEKNFFEEMEKVAGKAAAETARKILKWSEERGALIKWGKGKVEGTFYPVFIRHGVSYQFFGVYTAGRIEMSFQIMSSRPPFDSEEKRLELLRQLNEIPGIDLPESSINKWPTFPIGALTGEDALAHFFNAIEWAFRIAEAAESQDRESADGMDVDGDAWA